MVVGSFVPLRRRLLWLTVVAAAAALALALSGVGVGAATTRMGVELPPAASAPALQPPRFQEVVTSASSAQAQASTAHTDTDTTAAATVAATAAAAAAAAAAGHASGASRGGSGARAGGEWWVKDPPWFLPPPPEWGPMPPTMYTSFFHKPRYPALSTANYYPLYSREDEYDAHLPASMSRRAAHTQQLIYDHYVATYRDHMNGGPHAPLPFGDPNTGVRNPALLGVSHLGSEGGMAAAHMDAMQMQHPNNYVPGFSGNFRGAPSFVNGGAGGFGAGMAMSGAFLETAADTDAHHRSVTHFTASAQPQFLQTSSATASAADDEQDTEAESESEGTAADEEEDVEQELEAEDDEAEEVDSAGGSDETEVSDEDAGESDDSSDESYDS